MRTEPPVEQADLLVAAPRRGDQAGIEITTDDPRNPIEIDVEDNELPLSLNLPTWLVLAASGPALKLAHLLVLLHHQPPTDRSITHELLASLLGKSVDRVAAYTKELVAVGWLTVTRRRVSGWQVPNEYRYRNRPPVGSVTAATMNDLMAVADARTRKPPGQPVPAKTRVRSRTNAGHIRNYRAVLLIDRSIDRSSPSKRQTNRPRRNRPRQHATWSARSTTGTTRCRPLQTLPCWPAWSTPQPSAG